MRNDTFFCCVKPQVLAALMDRVVSLQEAMEFRKLRHDQPLSSSAMLGARLQAGHAKGYKGWPA